MRVDRDGRRGRTRAGRLAALDAWLGGTPLLKDMVHPYFVDVGLGDSPETTIELFHTLRITYPDIAVTGIDHAASRVEQAQAFVREGLDFSVSGFDLNSVLRPAHVVRACNVLRGYSLDSIRDARRRMSRKLSDGGWLIDATSSTDGHVCVALLMQRAGGALHRRALWFYTNGQQGFSPLMLRNYLPPDLRRIARNGHPLEAMFQTWCGAWEDIRHGAQDTFQASVLQMSEYTDFVWDSPGVAVWWPLSGVPSRYGDFRTIALNP